MGFYGSGFDGPSLELVYDQNQVASVLSECNITIVGDTEKDFLCFCPFHANTDTPAFSVSKYSGKYICFSGVCGKAGTLIDLVKRLRSKNDFQAARLIHSKKTEDIPFHERFAAVQSKEPIEFSQSVIDRMKEDLWLPSGNKAVEYLTGPSRGLLRSTLKDFEVGYSQRKNMIAVPMHDEFGKPVGVIGRSLTDHQFKNSKRLPVRQTLWNIHRAKAQGTSTVIVVEASMDGMRVAQAGYPNVVACLGGNFNDNHATQLAKYFDTIIICTDWDDSRDYQKIGCQKCARLGIECPGHNPGRDIGEKIANTMRGKTVKWGSVGYRQVYPNWLKDMSDLSDSQIRDVIDGAVSNFEYNSWGIYYHSDTEVVV